MEKLRSERDIIAKDTEFLVDIYFSVASLFICQAYSYFVTRQREDMAENAILLKIDKQDL